MRVLHIVKTTEGAVWALWQVAELVKKGVDVHVALPDTGGIHDRWVDTGATIHIVPLDFPVHAPWRLPGVVERVRTLVDKVAPDLIHTHHVGTTLITRYGLGKTHPIPRIFQVPGPLHLEHAMYRRWEISTSGPRDFWIGTSKCILRHYERAGVDASRLFLSYAGTQIDVYSTVRSNRVRHELGIDHNQIVVGNLNFIYAPKYYLGQRVGLKAHEDVIDALTIVTRERPGVVGLVAGGAWGNAGWYEERLRKRARAADAGRILMPGRLTLDQIRYFWADIDCAVHVPYSENCGGVLEPLLAGVPTIGGSVGGIPEVVLDGVTGKLAPIRDPRQLAGIILEVLSDLDRWRRIARQGQELVRTMFDVRRTSAEVLQVYGHILKGEPAPSPFDSQNYRAKGETTAVGG